MEKQNAIFWKPPGLLKAHQARVSPEQLLGPRQCSNPFPVPAPPRSQQCCKVATVVVPTLPVTNSDREARSFLH